jgi:hypothetical protein
MCTKYGPNRRKCMSALRTLCCAPVLRHGTLGIEAQIATTARRIIPFPYPLPCHLSLHDHSLQASILGAVLLLLYASTMRLLRINSDGNFSLTRFLPGEIPPYAILSHTWETDNQELTFQDMVNGAGRNKAGYRKIQFCRDQAKKDDLQYFWVDSCCIDKASSAELSEAINSMFRWYQDAVKCYVYLSDLSTSDVISLVSSRLPGGSPLSRSKWFTRGWTLQELLAPSSVEFFSKEGDWLGDKGTLELHISNITSIAVKALQGTPMSHFSLDERISWATDRQTTIEEDQAYCLLGIFEVHIPLIYGEGRKNAFRRLQEVAKFTSKPKPFSTVPFAPDPGFVNRPEFLAWIHDKCAGPGARAALVGLGGVGFVNVRFLNITVLT